MTTRNHSRGENRWYLMALIWAVLSSAIPSPGYAQVAATLSGIVADASGAVMFRSHCDCHEYFATGISTNSNTDETGKYDFLSLPPGKYNLVARKEGFKSATLSAIELVVFQKAEVNLRMELGEVRTVVEVGRGCADCGNVYGQHRHRHRGTSKSPNCP